MPGAFIAGFLVAAVLLAGCGQAGRAAPASTHPGSPGATVFPVAARLPVPAISGETLDGQRLGLQDLSGSDVVVVNVWASWCTSCREESASIADVAAQMRGQPVRFLGIDEQDSAPAARHFIAATGTAYPQLSDPAGDLLGALSLLPQTGIPSTLLIDVRGRMAARVIGPVTGEELRRLIASVREVA